MLKYILPVLIVCVMTAGSCSSKQKQFITTLAITDSAVTNGQLDTAVLVLKKRLQIEKLDYSSVVANYNAGEITIQSQLLDKDWIKTHLLRRGALVFYECYSTPDLANNLKEADKILAEKISKDSAGTTANPLFHVLHIAMPNGNSGEFLPTNIGNVLQKDLPLFKNYMELTKAAFPPDAALLIWERSLNKNKENYYEVYFVKENDAKFFASGHIEKAAVNTDDKRPAVEIKLDAFGAAVFKRMTTKNVNKTLAIVIDGVILTAPTVYSPIEGGNLSISANYEKKEALDIANTLQSGYLPLQLQFKNIEELKKAE